MEMEMGMPEKEKAEQVSLKSRDYRNLHSVHYCLRSFCTCQPETAPTLWPMAMGPQPFSTCWRPTPQDHLSPCSYNWMPSGPYVQIACPLLAAPEPVAWRGSSSFDPYTGSQHSSALHPSVPCDLRRFPCSACPPPPTLAGDTSSYYLQLNPQPLANSYLWDIVGNPILGFPYWKRHRISSLDQGSRLSTPEVLPSSSSQLWSWAMSPNLDPEPPTSDSEPESPTSTPLYPLSLYSVSDPDPEPEPEPEPEAPISDSEPESPVSTPLYPPPLCPVSDPDPDPDSDPDPDPELEATISDSEPESLASTPLHPLPLSPVSDSEPESGDTSSHYLQLPWFPIPYLEPQPPISPPPHCRARRCLFQS